MKNLMPFFFALLFSVGVVAYAATVQDDTQLEFEAGSYTNTEWNTNRVELSPGETSGGFISQVFDGGASGTVSWDEVSWGEQISGAKFLLIDNRADVYHSYTSGTSWSLTKDDYNAGDGNSLDDAVVDSDGYVYVVDAKDVWLSTDFGASWTKVSDDFGGGNSSNGKRIAVDSSDTLYIVDGAEDIWKSTNSGSSWSRVAENMNGGNGNVFGFAEAGGALYVGDAQADIWKSTDGGAAWSLVKDDYNETDGNSIDYMVGDSGENLVVLNGKDLWRSTDLGVSWTKVNDNFGGANGQRVAVDSVGMLYVVDGGEELWRSVDSGVSWGQISEDVAGANVSGFVVVPLSLDITFGVRAGDLNPLTGVFSGSYTNPAGSSLISVGGRYFQYKASLTTNDPGLSPELSLVSVSYSTSSLSEEEGEGAAEEDSEEGSSVVITGGSRPQTVGMSFSGFAYPEAEIRLFYRNRLDAPSAGVQFASFFANTEGVFSVRVDDLLYGDYLFALVVVDAKGRESGVVGFNADFFFDEKLFRGDDIYVAPTLGFESSVSSADGEVRIMGSAVPGSLVEVRVDGEVRGKTETSLLGTYEFVLPASEFSLGLHAASVRWIRMDGTGSAYSAKKIFRVSGLSELQADFNQDDLVNITDWSIFLSRWESSDVAFRSRADMNGDGKVTVADLSVFLLALRN